MSVARSIARRIFGRSIEVIDLEIAFHKEANPYGSHGTLIATHVGQGLKNAPVRFVFIGMSEPPALTPRIAEYIWEEARAQGYMPSAIQTYGSVLETSKSLTTHMPSAMSQTLREEVRFSERSLTN